MKSVLNYFVFILVATVAIDSSAQSSERNSTSYILPYVGVSMQGALDVEQTGVAHRRGDFSAFDTDFNLLVDVKGTSNQGIGYAFGLTYGTAWQKSGGKLKTGFELDVFYTSSSHESTLANPETEIVANVNGDSLAEVLEFVEEHYGAGLHTFSNSMEMTSLNAAFNLTLGYSFTDKLSINGALGFGISGITMNSTDSKQTGPVPAGHDYEITHPSGEDVNHFNTQTKSSANVLFAQFRLGTRISLSQNLALCIDARGVYRDRSDFTFGSTVYSDHAPTNSWHYSVMRGMGFVFSTGLCISL